MSNTHTGADDLLHIIDDASEESLIQPKQTAWKILVVDDDSDVHEATELTLKRLIIEGQPLDLFHVHSAQEAEEFLKQQDDIAIILLDVVMETEHAGLDLVKTIREKLNLYAVRIILRTGQPGYAPETETIQKYDINDYQTKSQLTHIRLLTILTSAIRAYRQICNQEVMRQGLESIVNASTKLASIHGMSLFAEGAVKQICALIGIEPEGLICAQSNSTEAIEPTQIIAAAGKYGHLLRTPLDKLNNEEIRTNIRSCLSEQNSKVDAGLYLYFSTKQGRGIVAYVDIDHPLEAIDQHLLEVFCANLTVGFDNVLMYNRLEEQAYCDPLLKVANLNRLLEFLCDSSQGHESSTLALIDIDEFSAINDSFGHKIGDRLLKSVSQRLSAVFPNSLLARVGSDVFAIVGLENEVTPERIIHLFNESFVIKRQEFKVTASIGLVQLGHHRTELTRIYKDAQVALKEAKLHHRGGAVTFSDDMGQLARDRIQLVAELKEAIEHNALFLMYQPKYNLITGQCTGVEALLRWRNKQGKLVPPDHFIPLAEQSGLMLDIGKFVIQQSCKQLSELANEGFGHLSMAINVSPAQLESTSFIQELTSTISDYQLNPEKLEIEVTETMAANNIAFMCSILSEVRKLGCSVAIDDFGTGFSSLSVLHKLPATRLKIDKSFVETMESDDSIAKMVVNLGQSLGMAITAEGIETEEQKEKLINLQCEEGQGWLFSKALEYDDLVKLLSL
jgi:diguanylate cyclase (GGDEF)-like protein